MFTVILCQYSLELDSGVLLPVFLSMVDCTSKNECMTKPDFISSHRGVGLEGFLRIQRNTFRFAPTSGRYYIRKKDTAPSYIM